MGQWLTSTMGTLELTSDQVKQIDEIKQNNYDFINKFNIDILSINKKQTDLLNKFNHIKNLT